jgi:hypothetical protein
VLFDVVGCGIICWIAGYRAILAIGVLPDSYPEERSNSATKTESWTMGNIPVDSHLGGKQCCKLVKFHIRKRAGHSAVHNDRHWLDGNWPWSDISVCTGGISCHFPHLKIANVPHNMPRFTGNIFKAVCLIRFAIIPVVVEGRQTISAIRTSSKQTCQKHTQILPAGSSHLDTRSWQ